MGQNSTPETFWIKVGTGLKTVNDFFVALEKAGCIISKWAKQVLRNPAFTVANQEENVELIILTTTQITGSEDGSTTEEVFIGAARLRLDKCQPEDGPQLCLQHPDQLKGTYVQIGMELIPDSDGLLVLFYIHHDDNGLQLLSECPDRNNLWDKNQRWAFRRRQQ